MANVVAHKANRHPEGGRIAFALFFCCLIVAAASFPAITSAAADGQYDRDTALQTSQSAIGNTLGNYSFTAVDGSTVHLSDYHGQPLLVSLIFTSCHHVCPTATKNLKRAADAAGEVLGESSFRIITVGFDTESDTPEAMRTFAREQRVDTRNWQFLSASAETIEGLSKDLGFQFYVSPRGFDHLNQLSIVNRQGKLYRQVYGVRFELPWLMEPLKQLVLNRPESAGRPLAAFIDRVRLFCTVYNPATGRYEIDNSLFFQIAAGLTVVLSIALYLFREARRARRL